MKRYSFCYIESNPGVCPPAPGKPGALVRLAQVRGRFSKLLSKVLLEHCDSMRRQRELAAANQACQHISHGAGEIHLRSFLAVIQEDEDPDSGILARAHLHVFRYGSECGSEMVNLGEPTDESTHQIVVQEGADVRNATLAECTCQHGRPVIQPTIASAISHENLSIRDRKSV